MSARACSVCSNGGSPPIGNAISAKGNQPALQAAIALYFEQRGAPAYAETPTLAHGRIECRCNYDEDRSRIRTGHGPANVSRLRHFALGVLKSPFRNQGRPSLRCCAGSGGARASCSITCG
jgi:hypothetical protein